MSEKIKQILKRIAGWLVYIAVVSLLIIGPNLYWLNSSAPWSGRQAVCGGESKDGIRSDLQRIVLDAADLNSGPVELSAELSYAPSQGIFYLRDGIFSVPLDTSDCQGLEGFQNGESFVAVKGTVEKDDEILILAVNGLRETVPIWVQIMYNAGIWGGIAGTIMLLAMGFAGVRALFRKLLVRIGRGKPKPDPLP
ncbi:MAG: hypothetical protein Q7S09_03430, partial [bacterium]|nr:hypothetical protein [bacterium]